MPTHDATTAQIDVLSFKEGLLSAVAHDLRLQADAFSIAFDLDAGTVSARIEAASVRVVCARVDGADAPHVLSDRDRREIEKNLRADVLETSRHPAIVFASTAVHVRDGGASLEGTLTLHGTSRPVRATVTRDGDAWTTELRLHQPDFGIRPFSAMLGALKIKPEVVVRVRVPA
jgi:polyisoprenoid-binding protein YceI